MQVVSSLHKFVSHNFVIQSRGEGEREIVKKTTDIAAKINFTMYSHDKWLKDNKKMQLNE